MSFMRIQSASTRLPTGPSVAPTFLLTVSLDSKLNSLSQTLAFYFFLLILASVSADIKLETENEEGIVDDAPIYATKNIYHPRVALRDAITDWLPEFFVPKEAFGPITKPHPPVTIIVPIIPIIPSVNTCMSLTTTTTTSTTTAQMNVPEVNTTQLQAFADVCSTVTTEPLPPIANVIMNSLVSPTKVITNDLIRNPIVQNVNQTMTMPEKIPVSSLSVIPIMGLKQDGQPTGRRMV